MPSPGSQGEPRDDEIELPAAFEDLQQLHLPSTESLMGSLNFEELTAFRDAGPIVQLDPIERPEQHSFSVSGRHQEEAERSIAQTSSLETAAVPSRGSSLPVNSFARPASQVHQTTPIYPQSILTPKQAQSSC